ncbi:hypothetical protein ASPZODRAFT_128445 [Penicilliopsis zonata CBS 506.65]|uniref:Large ribosomal subunit protein mL44 n=1 Tax=Penicilliopsis zonata CBS 506.65 TaxID=1073090 RepID=A0A1L9SRY5_9EURO|nr:hypothetical protein ASPZODRAFT_128445 [Penicilliopsis zonata CBS 506.65]OJJ49886.1 hypothetical protein ASPZODRAFT_128445 [Penicilliopsis zonata CBS 506.65]
MKRLQLQQWSGSALSPRARPACGRLLYAGLRRQTTVSSTTTDAAPAADAGVATSRQLAQAPVLAASSQMSRRLLPSPPVEAARESAKLAALHARLYLPSRFPLETLARTLVHASADPNADFNNQSLATLGDDLLAYYATEHLLCTYPRLPLTVVFAAMYAYVGKKTLAAMAREWGVELAAAPGGEVDPGLLQFHRITPGTSLNTGPITGTTRPNDDRTSWRRGMTSRVVYDDHFGEPTMAPGATQQSTSNITPTVTAEEASATFVRAIMGAIYLHAGRPAAKRFFSQHFLSRHLNISELFNFSQPARDLSRLCAREGFESPVAKIISETGRKSRHPVFVVGIFSGKDKLGEGAGSSLLEARSRAAVAALKGWYLYSPLDVRVPSSMEEDGAAPWKPVYIDPGEVVV